MKKILVPTDFSGFSENALDFGIQLAKKARASITLFHVIEKPSAQSFNTLSMVGLNDMEKLYQEGSIHNPEQKLRSAIAALKDSGVRIEYQLAECKSYDSISEIICKQETDLIIMGTRGSSGAPWRGRCPCR